MPTRPYALLFDEWTEGCRFYGSFESAERAARKYVAAHINGKHVPTVTMYHDGNEIATVMASGDGKVWVDIKDQRYPLALKRL